MIVPLMLSVTDTFCYTWVIQLYRPVSLLDRTWVVYHNVNLAVQCQAQHTRCPHEKVTLHVLQAPNPGQHWCVKAKGQRAQPYFKARTLCCAATWISTAVNSHQTDLLCHCNLTWDTDFASTCRTGGSNATRGQMF